MNYLSEIRSMRCALCSILGVEQTSRTDAHHPRFAAGMSQRASDFLAIPLCHETCHQGPNGIHGDRALLKIAKVEEPELLAWTIQRRANA